MAERPLYEQQELLQQLANVDYSKYSNSLEDGFIPAIYSIVPKTVEKVIRHFKSEKMGMVAKELGDMVARMFVTDDVERGEIVLDITIFIFITDDLLEHRTTNSARFQELQSVILKLIRNEDIPEGEYHEWRKIIQFAQPVFRKFQAMVSPSLFSRMSFMYDEYLQAVEWETSICSRNQIPDLETGILLKRHVSGWFVAFVLSEFAQAIEVPLCVRAHPDMQRLCTLACEVGLYDNDINSLKKEIRDGAMSNTILFIYLNDPKRNIQLAFDEIIHRRNQSERELKSIITRLPNFGDDYDVAQQYVQGIVRIIGGNYEWCRVTKRYHGNLDR